MKYCFSCKNFFYHDFESNRCPIRGCSGEVVSLDDDIALSIIHLNEIGYCTLNSCAGHFDTHHHCCTYIQFFGDIEFSLLPDGFEQTHRKIMDDSGCYQDVTCIRRRYDNALSEIELQYAIWETARDLLTWTLGLSPVNN